MGVGEFTPGLNSDRIDLMHWMFSATVTAAINSALVELDAVVDWAFNWHIMAPPLQVIACPVAELLFVGLFPHAARTKHTSLAFLASEGHSGGSFFSMDDDGVSTSGSNSMVSF